LVDDVATSRLDIAKCELLGFDDSDWKRYARKRFGMHSDKNELIAKMTSTLSPLEFRDEGGRVVPIFVDVLCNVSWICLRIPGHSLTLRLIAPSLA
jgi:hypothetical protein